MINNNFNEKIFEETLKIVLAEHEQNELDEYNAIILKEGKHKFSLEFEAKMKKLFKQAKKNISYIPLSKVFTRIAIAVLIAMSVSFAGLLTVKAVRQEIYNMFMTFYEKYIHVEFKNEDNTNKNADEIITEIYLPSYIPDGYEEYEISKSDNNIYAYYANNENNVISYQQGLVSVSIDFDGEDYVINDININGSKGKIYKYNKTDTDMHFTIIWNDSKYFYKIKTNLSEEETMKIAESIILGIR